MCNLNAVEITNKTTETSVMVKLTKSVLVQGGKHHVSINDTGLNLVFTTLKIDITFLVVYLISGNDKTTVIFCLW